MLSIYISVQFSSVAQSCPTLCDLMNLSMPGLPVHHQLLEFTQIHVYIYIYIYTNTDIVPNLAIYHIVTIVHSAIMNIVVYMSFQLVFSFPSNKQMLYECNVHIVNIVNDIMYQLCTVTDGN